MAMRTHGGLGEFEQAAQVAAKALAAATEGNDNWAMSWVLLLMGNMATAQGQATHALPLYDRALTVMQADPTLADLRLLLHINKAVMLGCLDQYEQAFTAARTARDLAAQAGSMIRLTQAHGALAELLFETGQWDDALAEVARLPESLKEPGGACCELGIAAVINFYRGETAAARRYLVAASPHAMRIGHRPIGPLALAISLDREHDGSLPEALAALTAWSANTTEHSYEAEGLLADAVRIATKTGDSGTAESLASYAALLAAESAVPHRQANALYCRGLIDHDAPRLLNAADHYGDASRPLHRAKALEAAGRELLTAGNQDQAVSALTEAATTYTRLGAAADAARLQDRS